MRSVINTFNYRLKQFLLPPHLHPKLYQIKKALGCRSKDIVIRDGKSLIINGYVYDCHELYHFEISNLPRIRIGKDLVSGIHGIDSQVLHQSKIKVEYDGLLDECRVAIHEWLTRTSVFNTIKAFNWMIWLVSIKVNPLAVIILHVISIKNYQGELSFDFEQKNRINLYKFLNKLRLI